ncbi:MAG: CBS domain-containing protein [Gemmatimonadetes bacterium]|nr:CBS domain-containing protein [Gemmatimonadota bacterium]NNM07194.1 CBS domain-containing protein [Gemmatimonadota bacterium]
MKIRDLLNEKGYDVVTVPPSFPLQDAMRLLVEHNIGSVVVAQEKAVKGILTERDILRLAANDPASMAAMKVEQVMTKDVVVALPEDSVDYVMEIMTKNRIRHLPIVDQGWMQGILSIGDVVNALRKKVEVENNYMKDYIRGVFS